MKENEWQFRPATDADAAAIMEIIDYARQRMLAEGKQQWNESYPLLEHIEADIHGGHGYVICQAGEVAVYGAIIFGEEPAYNNIRKGQWLSDLPYVVVHRLAVSGKMREQGLGTRFMQQVEKLMLQRGVHSFRVDTNFDNFAMQRVLEKLHFRYCGEIAYERGVRMAYEKLVWLTTERLILRPWRDSDAETLYKYAKDPAIGLVAGWPPHTSVEQSREIIRTVFAAPETYAVVLKETGEPIGSIGIMFGNGMHSAAMQEQEAEIGYWIGVPYWGQGLIPEAMRCLLHRCFVDLRLSAVWCGYYDGNRQSQRVMEKCGLKYHHTETDKASPLGDIRTEHFMRITADEWE